MDWYCGCIGFLSRNSCALAARPFAELARAALVDLAEHAREIQCVLIAYLTGDVIDRTIGRVEEVGYGRVAGAEEGYGVLDTTWGAPANSTHLSQLQALQTATLTP